MAVVAGAAWNINLTSITKDSYCHTMRLVTRDSVYIPGIKLIYDTRVNMVKRDLKYVFVSAIYALQLYVFYLNKGKGELHPGTPSPGTVH